MLPAKMRAVVLRAIGPASNLEMRDVPVRDPGEDEVVVRVRACAVAYRDILDRTGAFKFIKPDMILGHEFAGTVVAAGKKVKRFSSGDNVVSLHWDQDEAWPSPLLKAGPVKSFFGLTMPGGYAEYVTAPAGAFANAPNLRTPADSCCVVSTFGTVWNGAVTKGRVHTVSNKGDKCVVIPGASGGVGSAAVQLMNAMGFRTVAVSSTESKADFLRKMVKAKYIVQAKDGKFIQPPETAGSSVPMVIDCVGGPTFDSSLRIVSPGGKVVLLGNVNVSTVKLPLGYCILNNITVLGSDSIHYKELEESLYPFMMDNKLSPIVSDVMPLDRVATAHAKVENKGVVGRVVLDVWDAGERW